jgi:hypothetical protein
MAQGIHREKGAAQTPERAAPNSTNYYETQISGSLVAANLLQSNQNCDNETTSGAVLFNIASKILLTGHAGVDFKRRPGSIGGHSS